MLALAVIALLWIGIVLLLHWQGRAQPARRRLTGDVAAGGALLLLTLGFFWRTLSGDVYQPADGGDLVSFLFPTYRFAADALATGTLPLWNPHLYGGAPFIADIQAGFLYLPNLILFLINPAFPYVTLQWLAILHLWWAGLGVYVLLRLLPLGGRQLHPLAAFFGAVVFTFCDPLLIHLGNLNLIAVLAWMPWVLAAFDRALRSRSLRWMGIAALLFAIGSYAGHAQSSLLIALALGVYALAWAACAPVAEEARWRTFGWSVGLLASTGLLTGLLLAPILLPAAELTQYTQRAEFSYQESVAFSLAPAQLIGLITPGFFGRGPALHWSLWQRVELPYLGIAALVMAVAALLLARGRQRRDVLPWLLVALVGMVTALGVYALAHGWLTAVLPFFGQLRAPARALILWALGGSVLAGMGLEILLREPLPPRLALTRVLQWGTAILLGVALPLLYLAMLLTQESEIAFVRASVALLAIALAAVCWLATWALVAARGSGRLSPVLFAVGMIGLLYFDLSGAGAYTDISPNDPTVNFNHAEIADFLRSDTDIFRIDTLTDIQDLWQPDTAALLGFEDVGGIANPLALASMQAYWGQTGGRDTLAYNLLNVKYVILRDGTPLPDAFELALDAEGPLAVYRNTGFIARAWFTTESGDTLAPDAEQPAIALTRANVNHLRAEFVAPAAGTLVLSEVWYPGWQAQVNGAVVEARQVNGLLRAVDVPSGQVTLEMNFAPSTLRIGWIALGGGVVLLALLLMLGRTRRVLQRIEE